MVPPTNPPPHHICAYRVRRVMGRVTRNEETHDKD